MTTTTSAPQLTDDDYSEMLLSSRNGQQLHIGDRIALCVQRNGKMYAVGSEGFIELSCSLREVALGSTVPWGFVECQWIVYVKCQYDAAKRVRRALKAQARAAAQGKTQTMQHAIVPTMGRRRLLDMKSIVDLAQASRAKLEEGGGGTADAAEVARQQQADLALGVEVEQAANAARNHEKRGTPINYGETIQLMHAKSGKFLKLVPKHRAQAMGCYQVVLDPKGSEDSWLSLRPRFKFQIEGAAIKNHDMLRLHSNRRQLSLHFGPNIGSATGGGSAAGGSAAADSAAGGGGSAVAGAGAAAAGGGEPAGGKADGAAGPAATSESVVSESSDELEVNASTDAAGFQLLVLNSSEEGEGGSSSGGQAGSGERELMRCGDVISLYHCEAESNLVASWDLRTPLAEVGMRRYESLEWVGANALWQVQAANGLNTEPVAMGCGYCLQHLPSGKYLAVDMSSAASTGFPLPLMAATLEQAALFELHDYQSEGSAKHMPAASIVRMRHVASGGWVHTEPETGKVVVAQRCYIRDGMLAERPTRVCRTFYGVSGVTGHLLRHAESLQFGTKTGNEADPKVTGALAYLTRFLTSDIKEASGEDGGSSGPSDDAVSANLQDLMRELGVLDALITMLVAPFKRLGTVAFHKLDDDKPLIQISRMVAELLWVSIRGNSTNCQYIYSHVPSFELAARKSIGIGQVLQEVFSEVQVEPKQVDFWVDLLAKERRDRHWHGGWMILSLLHTFCMRHGAPLAHNQNMILLKLIISPASDMMEAVQVARGGDLVVTEDVAKGSGVVDGAGGPQKLLHTDSAAASVEFSEVDAGVAPEPSSALAAATTPGAAASSSKAFPLALSPAAAAIASDAALSMRDRAALDIFSRSKEMLQELPDRENEEFVPVEELDHVDLQTSLRDQMLQSPSLVSVVSDSPAALSAARSRGYKGKKAGAASSKVAIQVQGAWLTMGELEDNVDLQKYYLHEVELLGGLCSGFNGLTLQTVWSLYPFNLCMKVILDDKLSQDLRGGYCVLVRNLYIGVSPSRLGRPAVSSVWDWDLLPKGRASGCLSLNDAVLPTDAVSQHDLDQLRAFVLQEMRSARMAMREQRDLDLTAGVLDLCLHLFMYGFIQDQETVESLFELAVAIISVPQHRRIDKSGKEDKDDENFSKALRVKKLVCHILEQILDMRLMMRLWKFLESLRRKDAVSKRAFGIIGSLHTSVQRNQAIGSAVSPLLRNSTASPAAKASQLKGSGPDIVEGLRETVGVMAWPETTDNMIRALVRTTTEASSSDPGLVSDALHVLFRLFRQSHSMCKCMLSIEFVKESPSRLAKASSGERHIFLAMQRATRFLQHLTMSIRALTSTQPRPDQAADVLSNAQLALAQLIKMCDAPHRQALLWCLGTHEVVFALLKVMSAVETQGETQGTRMPPDQARTVREGCFELLSAFCERNERNQGAVFSEFSLVLAHMCTVRKATTCARLVLQDNPANCAAVTDAHLSQLIGLMSEGSARYAWYLDVLLELTRGLDRGNSTVPLSILRLFLAKPNYLLILFPGKAGRERRARQLATKSGVHGTIPPTSMVAFHHALVQLLAQLSFGFHNEVEMLIQSIMPLDELCEHICDHFCPHAVRASFLVLLKETYTITQLKVAALAISPSVWQVITLLVAELRTLCECMGGYGDVEDAEQAVRQLEFSHRGPCFFEAGIDFALNFLHKHLSLSDTPRENWEVLNSFERVTAKLLKLIEKRPFETNPRMIGSDDGRGSPTPNGDSGKHESGGARGGGVGLGAKRELLLTRRQVSLLKAALHALHIKGIQRHEKMWKLAGDRLNLRSLAQLQKEAPRSPAPAPAPAVLLPPSPTLDLHHKPPGGLNGGTDGGSGGDSKKGLSGAADGAALEQMLRKAYHSAEAALEEWQLEEFNSSVQTYKECGEEAIRPIIQQLNRSSPSVEMRERGLNILQALLEADPSMQDSLNDMGATAVMLQALVDGGSDRLIFEAGLGLGCSLLEGGNNAVQVDIYEALAGGSHGGALLNLAAYLDDECRKIQQYYTEVKQRKWYLQVMNQSEADARADGDVPELRRLAPLDVRVGCKVLHFVQLLCEGHYNAMQNFLRSQEGNRTNVNVVMELVNSLLVIERTLSSLTIGMACQLYETLIELVQGPCHGNQLFLIGTNLCDVVVRFLHGVYPDCSTREVVELKLLCLKLLLSLLEGVQTDTIPRRIAASLDLMLLVRDMDSAYRNSSEGVGVSAEEIQQRDLGFYFFLLMRTLGRYSASVSAICQTARSFDFFSGNTGCIEIVRSDRTLDEVLFPVPVLCKWLTSKSKLKFMWDVDRSTPQKRIEDFVTRSEGLIYEMHHQEQMAKVGFLHMLTLNSGAMHTAMLTLGCAINLLIILCSLPSPMPTDYLVLRWSPSWAEWLTQLLGVGMFLVSSACLLEHCAATMPLLLRAAWAADGVDLSIVSIWPLQVDVQVSDELRASTEKAAAVEAEAAALRPKATSTSGDESLHDSVVRAHRDEVQDESVRVGLLEARADQDTLKDCLRAMARIAKRLLASSLLVKSAVLQRLTAQVDLTALEHHELIRHVLLRTPLLLLFKDQWLLYYVLSILNCTLGLLVHPFFFVPLLLDIVVQSRLLQKVIEAVTINSQSLFLTFLLVLIVIYQFTIVGQLFFHEDYIWHYEVRARSCFRHRRPPHTHTHTHAHAHPSPDLARPLAPRRRRRDATCASTCASRRSCASETRCTLASTTRASRSRSQTIAIRSTTTRVARPFGGQSTCSSTWS